MIKKRLTFGVGRQSDRSSEHLPQSLGQLIELDGSQFLVEKSHPLFSRIHLAAPCSTCFFWPGEGEAFFCTVTSQEAKRLQQGRMIEAVVMLAIGLSMAGVVLGNLNNDQSA